jgi:hypothetical protein
MAVHDNPLLRQGTKALYAENKREVGIWQDDVLYQRLYHIIYIGRSFADRATYGGDTLP